MLLLLHALTCFLSLVAAQPAYYPNGPQENIPYSTVTSGGWSLCYSDLMSDSGTLLSTILSQCSGSYLMLGGRAVGSNTILLLAAAPRANVLYDASTCTTCGQDANGSKWYYSNSHSWGFALAGAVLNRNQCDWQDTTVGWSRLCFHCLGAGGALSGGYRIGSIVDLNSNPSYQRLIFSSNGVAPDTTPPAWSNCPANIVTNGAPVNATVTWTAPVATDNVGVSSQSSTRTSGSIFTPGTTTVTYTATDAAGNAGTCSFTVTVNSVNCSSVLFTPYLLANESSIVSGSTLQLRLITSWAYDTTTISFVGSGNAQCNSPSPAYWTSTIHSSNTCNLLYQASLPINWAMTNCNFRQDESVTSETRYSATLLIRTVRQARLIRGLWLNQTLETSVTVAVVYSTAITTISASLNVYGSGLIYARLLSQTYNVATYTATLILLTSMQYPYQLTASQLASVAGFTSTIAPINPEAGAAATAQCVSGVTSPCNQQWQITLTRSVTSTGCLLGPITLTNSGWQASWTIGCHASFTGSCATPAPSTAGAQFDTASDDMCPRLISTRSASASLTAFSDSAFSAINSQYVFGARTYYRAIVNADINIQAVRIESVAIISGAAAGVNVIYSNAFTNASHFFGATQPAGTYGNQPAAFGGIFSASPTLMLISENLAGASNLQRMVQFSWVWSAATSGASGDASTAAVVRVELRVRYANQSIVSDDGHRITVTFNGKNKQQLLAESAPAMSADTVAFVQAAEVNDSGNNNNNAGSTDSSSSTFSDSVLGSLGIVGAVVAVVAIAAIAVLARRMKKQSKKEAETTSTTQLTQVAAE